MPVLKIPVKLFKDHIRHIEKSSNFLSYSKRLNGTQVILGEENQQHVKDAIIAMDKARWHLSQITRSHN